jgi:hypothetical protein
MKKHNLDEFSTQRPLLRAKRAELHTEITKRKAECALIRERIQKDAIERGNDHENRVNALLGRPTVPAPG